MILDYQRSSQEILDFERRAEIYGVANVRQTNYSFYDYEKAEYFIVRNQEASLRENEATISFIPLELDITEVTITRPAFGKGDQ